MITLDTIELGQDNRSPPVFSSDMNGVMARRISLDQPGDTLKDRDVELGQDNRTGEMNGEDRTKSSWKHAQAQTR